MRVEPKEITVVRFCMKHEQKLIFDLEKGEKLSDHFREGNYARYSFVKNGISFAIPVDSISHIEVEKMTLAGWD